MKIIIILIVVFVSFKCGFSQRSNVEGIETYESVGEDGIYQKEIHYKDYIFASREDGTLYVYRGEIGDVKEVEIDKNSVGYVFKNEDNINIGMVYDYDLDGSRDVKNYFDGSIEVFLLDQWRPVSVDDNGSYVSINEEKRYVIPDPNIKGKYVFK